MKETVTKKIAQQFCRYPLTAPKEKCSYADKCVECQWKEKENYGRMESKTLSKM